MILRYFFLNNRKRLLDYHLRNLLVAGSQFRNLNEERHKTPQYHFRLYYRTKVKQGKENGLTNNLTFR